MRQVSFWIIGMLFFSIAVPPIIHAQSNETLDVLLAEESLTAGSAAYVLLTAVQEISDETSRDDALAELKGYDFAYLLSGKNTDSTLSLGEFSFLAQQVFELPGGLMSGIFPGPRYALRDLQFLKIVRGRAYPKMELSGERAGRIIGRILAEKEARS